MATFAGPCNQSYDFFSSIEAYVNCTKTVDIFTELRNFNEKCKFVSQYDNRIQSNNVCQKFQYFYELLSEIKPTTSGKLYMTDYEYLNFWLNYQLRSINNNDYSIVNKFYNNMVDSGAMFKDKTELHNKICYIQEDIFKNMDILYTLYNNFLKIYDDKNIICGNKESCSVYTEECLKKYKKGIYQCPKEKKDNFCYEIRKLKSEYEAKKNEKLNDGSKISDLMILPERQENNSHGKWFCNKKNKKREIKENINQETQRLLYKSEENKVLGNRKQYNILYNS
ncbi:PIR protein [Plasmodium vivax]|uniref:VIR protein n=1 Tax=Plasmodium vivax TaxID=5855 RepID=A0A565A3J6_PLAVI|nr:PIR protein [Plasmodium vivax]